MDEPKLGRLTPSTLYLMKRTSWLQLVALNLLVVVCIVLPFVPGPYDALASTFSAVAQTTGLVGLLLVPVAFVWLIQEIRLVTNKDVQRNNWTNGYYFANAAVAICIFIALFYALGFLLMAGPTSSVLLLIGAGLA